MNKIDKDEMFENLRGFLKGRGVSIEDGSYSKRIQQGCNLLTDVVNATGSAVERAKVEADKAMDKLRQSIHEATAPAASTVRGTAAAAGGPAPKSRSARNARSRGGKHGSGRKPGSKKGR